MEKVYENLLGRIDKQRMEAEGVYITFYDSLEEYIEEQQEFDYSREEVIEEMSNHVDVDELEGSFIMLESQSAEGMYVWIDEDVEDIIGFLKSETAYRKFVR